MMNSIIPLDENDIYVLFKEYEDVFLFENDTNEELWRISVHGEATCGVLVLKNDWAVIGGGKLIVWNNNKLHVIDDAEVKWIYDLRQVDDYGIEILTDPWSDGSAIWFLNVQTLSKYKLKDFPDYRNKEYIDDIIW